MISLVFTHIHLYLHKAWEMDHILESHQRWQLVLPTCLRIWENGLAAVLQGKRRFTPGSSSSTFSAIDSVTEKVPKKEWTCIRWQSKQVRDAVIAVSRLPCLLLTLCFIQFVQLSTTILSMATLHLIRTNNVEEFLAMRLYQWSSATSISLRIAEDVCQRKMINQDQ